MDTLDDIAAELAQRARQVEVVGDQLVRAAACALWTSAGGEAFRAQVGRRREQCSDIAGSLRSASGSVRSYADAVATERALLAHLARRLLL